MQRARARSVPHGGEGAWAGKRRQFRVWAVFGLEILAPSGRRTVVWGCRAPSYPIGPSGAGPWLGLGCGTGSGGGHWGAWGDPVRGVVALQEVENRVPGAQRLLRSGRGVFRFLEFFEILEIC